MSFAKFIDSELENREWGKTERGKKVFDWKRSFFMRVEKVERERENALVYLPRTSTVCATSMVLPKVEIWQT